MESLDPLLREPYCALKVDYNLVRNGRDPISESKNNVEGVWRETLSVLSDKRGIHRRVEKPEQVR